MSRAEKVAALAKLAGISRKSARSHLEFAFWDVVEAYSNITFERDME